MKKLFLSVLIFTASIQISYAQKISGVDFDALKQRLETTAGLYADLLSRFVASDTTLTSEDFSMIYYGQCFQDDYNPYGFDEKVQKKFLEHYRNQDFGKALPFALKMLEKDPLNMKVTLWTMVCYHELKNEAEIDRLSLRYYNIMKTIMDSGDGKTSSTAFVVMRVSDEYELMGNLNVENSSQSLIGTCDLMILKPNDLGLERLYFDVTKPIRSMIQGLK